MRIYQAVTVACILKGSVGAGEATDDPLAYVRNCWDTKHHPHHKHRRYMKHGQHHDGSDPMPHPIPLIRIGFAIQQQPWLLDVLAAAKIEDPKEYLASLVVDEPGCDVVLTRLEPIVKQGMEAMYTIDPVVPEMPAALPGAIESGAGNSDTVSDNNPNAPTI